MASVLFIGGKFTAFDDNGDLLSNGKVYFFEVGTSTPKKTYSDSALTVDNAHPVILNSRGQADIFLDGEYKYELRDSLDTLLETQPNINPTDSSVQRGTFNLAINGSFETVVNSVASGWVFVTQADGTVEIDTDATHGANCVKFTSLGNGGGYIESDSFIDASQLNTYRISVSLKSSVVDVRNIFEIRWFDSGQSLISSTTAYDEAAANPTSYTEILEKWISPPANTRYAKLRLYGADQSDPTPGVTRIDNVVFKQVEVPALIDLTNATTDYNLRIGETAKIEFSSATEKELRIATDIATGFYKMVINTDSDNTATNVIALEPNSTTYSNEIIRKSIEALGGTVSSPQSTESIFNEIGNHGEHVVDLDISTKDSKRYVIGATRDHDTGVNRNTYLYQSYWEVGSTSWTSLGKVTFSESCSGEVLIFRFF